MTSVKPDIEPVPALKRLMEAGARVRPLSSTERATLYERVEAGALRPKSRMPASFVAVAFALLVAVTLYQTLHVPTPPLATHRVPIHTAKPMAPGTGSTVASAPAVPATESLSLGGRGELSFEPGSAFVLPPEATRGAHAPVRVTLEHGSVTASVSPRAADEPFSVVTPQVVVTVVGTRFTVDVANDVTIVSVEHGRVRVEKGTRTVFVGVGESVRSDDPRFDVPRSPRVTAEAPAARHDDCVAPSTRAARRTCLEADARGVGLIAENALVSLAFLDRDGGDANAALARFREYERRFPAGALAPEVALAVTRMLKTSAQRAAACAEAEDFARRFPGDSAMIARLHTICSE